MYRTLLICLAIGCLVTGGAVSATDHGVTLDGAMDIPERTVSIGGESYQMSSLARVPRGDELRARTSGADGPGYRVYIHDVRGTVVDQQYVAPSGNETVGFDTSTYEAGSYVVSLYHDGTYYDPHPVVIPAYDVSLDAPSSDRDGDEAGSISVGLTERESGHTAQRVTAVVSNATTTRRYRASRVDGEYVVGLDEMGLASGTYSVYAVVVNENDAPGPTNEIIGISNSSRIDVERNASGTGGSESGEIGGENETTDIAASTNTSDSGASKPPVISPNRPANETVEQASTDDDAGGTPFALLSLAVIIGYLVVRGPDRAE